MRRATWERALEEKIEHQALGQCQRWSIKVVNTPATSIIIAFDQLIPYILGERALCLPGQGKGPGEGLYVEK